MSRRSPLAPLALLLAIGCGQAEPEPESPFGGLSLQVVFGADPAAPGRGGLRLAAVPPLVDRLQFAVLGTDGSTLAETNLYAQPAEAQLPLVRAGGSWRLDQVPVGSGRSIVGKAYLGRRSDPALDGAVLFAGRLDGVTVRPGRVTDVGTLTLASVGPRVPEEDTLPPDAPPGFAVTAREEGGAADVSFDWPPQPDVFGFIVAVGTSSVVGAAPSIDRSWNPLVGDAIVPGLVVAQRGRLQDATELVLRGLRNGVTHTVLAYAFDADGDGLPLNYSAPAVAWVVPADRAPPGLVRSLSVTASVGAARPVRVSFEAPSGETPAGYEVRASLDPAQLDGARFDALPWVPPPETGGGRGLGRYAPSELGVPVGEAFFVGVRARDAAGNLGDVAVARFDPGPPPPPTIERSVPQIARAGGELRLEGRGFGVEPGRVELVTTGTAADAFDLPVVRWSPGVVIARVPARARSGQLRVQRSDGSTGPEHGLAVVLALPGRAAPRCAAYRCSSGDEGLHPFELVGAGALDGSTTGALHRECCEDSGRAFVSGVERVLGLRGESRVLAEQRGTDRPTAVAGTSDPSGSRFLFVSADGPRSMSTTLVSASADAPQAVRRGLGVAAGGAERVSVAALDRPAGAPAEAFPALLAFSVGGVVRTATVDDAALRPFAGFFALRDDEALLDRPVVVRDGSGAVVLAHRRVDTGGAALWVRRNTRPSTDPGAFDPVPGGRRERVGPGLELLSVPRAPGGAEQVVVAYEAEDAAGRSRVRVAPIERLESGPGLAPLPDDGVDQRLSDAGLVMRDGAAWIALLIAHRHSPSRIELTYTELPLSAVEASAPVDGAHPGLALDLAGQDAQGRLGCKPLPQNTCPIVWLGEDLDVLYVRR